MYNAVRTSASYPTMEPNRLKPTILASSMFKSGVLASLTLLGAACSTNSASTAPPTNNGASGIVAGTLEVTIAGTALKLRNTTEQQVGYMVVDKEQMVIALYPPCAANCPVLVQGATASVPFSAIGGYTSQSTEARVMWWKYVVRADGTKVADGPVQTVSVKLK